MKIALILGTRPEVLKLAPIIFEFKKHKVCCISIIDTQQQASIKEQALRDYQIEPSIRLQAPKSHDLNDKSSHIQFQLNRVLKKLQVDSIIVQGDTLSAFNLSIPIIHLETGLRSHLPFSPYPEEAHRRMISCMTSLHLAPNQLAVNNLLSEGIQEETIKLVGNPLTDLKPDNLIFSSNRKGGRGRGNLYISFALDDGGWTQAVSMGDTINSEGHELCPFVSLDGRYFFFTSREDIYWMDASIIEALRPTYGARP